MKKIIKNLSGLYLGLKKDNSKFNLSKEKIADIMQNPPNWMERQIENDFEYLINKPNNIDETIQNFKKSHLLESAQIIRIYIRNNKINYQNFLPIKHHPRFIRLKNYFMTISKFMTLPDVDFLYSIHDTFDSKQLLDCLRSPIFCISKLKKNNKVILFPHVEWMQKNELLLKEVCKADLQIDWQNKNDKAFWRGSITGSEDLKKNDRFKIVKFACQYPDFFDVYFSDISLNKNKANKLSLFLKSGIDPKEQIKYKYLLAIDGNAFAGSFFWQLFSNSLILKNHSNYLQWFYLGLKNNEHFVEYSNEKDLLQKILFFRQNDLLAKNIIKNANHFANNYLTNESIAVYICRLLEKYSIKI